MYTQDGKSLNYHFHSCFSPIYSEVYTYVCIYPQVAEQHSLQGSSTEHHNYVCNLSLYYLLPTQWKCLSLECNTLFVNCTLLGQRPRRILNQFESRLTVVRTPSWSVNAQARTLGIFVIPNSNFEISNFIFLNFFSNSICKEVACVVF